MKVKFINKDKNGFEVTYVWEDNKYKGDDEPDYRAADCSLEHAVEVNANVSRIRPFFMDGLTCIDIIAENEEQTRKIKEMYANACNDADKQINVCSKMGCDRQQMNICCRICKWGECERLTKTSKRE